MKIFLSFAYSNTNITETTELMKTLVNVIKDTNNQVYCNLFDDYVKKCITQDNTKAIFQHTLNLESKQNVVFVIISEPKISNGQLLEIGVALHQKIPIIIFENNNVKDKSYIKKLSNQKYSWDSKKDLIKSVKDISNNLSFIVNG